MFLVALCNLSKVQALWGSILFEINLLFFKASSDSKWEQFVRRHTIMSVLKLGVWLDK